MPSLSLASWEKYVPSLGDNKDQEKPFYLLVRSGLTRTEFEDLLRRVGEYRAKTEKTGEDLAALFKDYVKMGDEPLTVDGTAIEGLLAYLRLISAQVASPLMLELVGCIKHFNSVEGVQESFYARLSGGRAFTANTAPGTVGSRDGSGTKH